MIPASTPMMSSPWRMAMEFMANSPRPPSGISWILWSGIASFRVSRVVGCRLWDVGKAVVAGAVILFGYGFMSWRKVLGAVGCGLCFLGVAYAFQRPFRQYRGVEYYDFVLPQDWQGRGEWQFAPLMFPPGPNHGYRARFDSSWRLGVATWVQGYPGADPACS